MHSSLPFRRFHALLAYLLLAAQGCGLKDLDDDIDEIFDDEPEDCAAPSPYPDGSDVTIRGERDVSALASPCDREVCSERMPLASGMVYDFGLYLDPEAFATGTLPGDYTLTSAAPHVVRVNEVTGAWHFNGERFDRDQCVDWLTVALKGTLEAVGPGSALLTLARDGVPLDTYTIMVGNPSSVDAGFENDASVDAGEGNDAGTVLDGGA